MMHRRTALIGAVSLAAIPRIAAAQSSAQDSADLGRIQAYLNSVRGMRSRFVQTAPDGGISQGEAYMLRPGKMRFQYDPPAPYLLVANYGVLVFHDSQLNQTSKIPLGRTPLGILLADQTNLSGDVSVTRFVRLPGQFQVSLVRTASPGEGTLILTFADNPLTLRQWTVLDAQGKQTRISLVNMDVSARLDPKLFEFRDSDVGSGGNG